MRSGHTIVFDANCILKVRLDDLLHRCLLLSLEEYIGDNVLATTSLCLPPLFQDIQGSSDVMGVE